MLLTALVTLVSCVSIPEKHHWQTSFISAAKDPYTWAPLGGAALVAASGKDQRISEKLIEETPLFGSNKASDKASDDLRDVTSLLKNISALMVEPECDIYTHPVQRMLVQQGIVIGSDGIAAEVKDITERKRPTSDGNTFPSQHANKAFSYHAITRENLRCATQYSNINSSIHWFSAVSATGTAYARVEAGAHYPVDVLAGAGLGNFLVSTINGALRAKKQDNALVRVGFIPMEEGFVVYISSKFPK